MSKPMAEGQILTFPQFIVSSWRYSGLHRVWRAAATAASFLGALSLVGIPVVLLSALDLNLIVLVSAAGVCVLAVATFLLVGAWRLLREAVRDDPEEDTPAMIISGNYVSNNGRDGIHVRTGGRVHVQDSTSHDNGRDGIHATNHEK